MSYAITIESTDRTDDIIDKSVTITDEAKDKPSVLEFKFFDTSGNGDPSPDDEIIITQDGTRLFAGHIVKVDYERLGSGSMLLKIKATDYTRILDRKLVVESYQDKTDKQIIKDIVDNYCQGSGISYDNVTEGVTFNEITFNYDKPSACFRKMADLAGRSWYLDYNKDVHYFTKTTTPAPWDIDSNTDTQERLKISKDNSNIRNRVYVRGGTYLSDQTTISQEADGEQTVFWLPDKPHDFSMTEGGSAKTVGIKHIDDDANYDYMMNYQEKYVETTGSAPAAGTVMQFTYKYDIPVLVAVENSTSIDSVGEYEYAIFDNKITDVDDARGRASAELTDYADTIIDGDFQTIEDGFRAGQYININLSDYNVNDDYLVQKVTAHSLGGGTFQYKVKIASSTKIGIINFLLKLLEQDKNFLDIDPDEVVDELFQPDSQGVVINDSIVTESLITPPYQWNSFKWNLAEWS